MRIIGCKKKRANDMRKRMRKIDKEENEYEREES